MRALVAVLVASALAGCDDRKFKVGDCVIANYPVERWDSPHKKRKILEIGFRAYRTSWGEVSFFADSLYDRVECAEDKR